MLTFNLSEKAKRDLKEIHSYIAEDNLFAADRLADEISERFRFLLANPAAGRLMVELGSEIRLFPFRRYLIYYTVTEDGIEIVRVLHSARDVESEFEM